MALSSMKSDLVRFSKKATGGGSHSQPLKKVNNFFDDEEEVVEDEFETFENDKDFAKMGISFDSKDKDDFGDSPSPEEGVGQSWGGRAYRLKDDTAISDQFKANTQVQGSFKPSLNQKPIETKLQPQIRDKINAKSTETTQVFKTTVRKEETRVTTTFSEKNVPTNTTRSIENVVQSTKSEMSNAEKNRLQAEVKELRKVVLNLRQQHRKVPQPSETVKKLMLNQPCVLEVFKSLVDKLTLLDETIKIGDGDALITTILFIKKTVKYSIFAREISRRPVAVKHIVAFMKSHYDYDELVKLLRHLGRKEEAMMLEYKRALSLSNPDAQLQAINTCQRSYEGSPELADAVSVLKEHQALLKRQIQIETKDKRTQAAGRDPVMQDLHPVVIQLSKSTLISTLHYCCYYHYGENDDILDPLSLQKDFKLSDKQFEWTAIGARATLKKWGDLEGLFNAKGWFGLGSNKLKSSLGFDKVVGILQKNNAPPDILSKYLAFVEIPETRLSLAVSLQCHKVAVETIVSMKDRQKLEEYRKTIERCHPVQSTISSYLQNSQIKWK